MERVSSSHSYGESGLHLQFTPKYRRQVFRDTQIQDACRQQFVQIAKSLGIHLNAVEFGPDHTHMFVSNWKNYAIPELAQRFKGASSKRIRETLWNKIRPWRMGKSFWTDGYFYETCGSVTAESRTFYIERCQSKHWVSPITKNQSQLTNWLARKPSAL